MKKALVIIDMQIMPFLWKDYGGKPLYREEALIARTKSLIQKARHAQSPIFYILYTEKGESPRAENQPLWQVHPEIAPQDSDILIVKYHADSFLETTLKEELQNRGITDLIFCGVQTEYCVDTTIKSAFSHGFSNELVSDAHSTYDTDLLSAEQIIAHHNSILTQFCSVSMEQDVSFS